MGDYISFIKFCYRVCKSIEGVGVGLECFYFLYTTNGRDSKGGSGRARVFERAPN